MVKRHWVPAAIVIWAAIFGLYEVVERTLLAGVSPSTLHLLHILRGTGTSFILAAVVAGLAIRRGDPPETRESYTDMVARARWLIWLRWIAICGVVLTVATAHLTFDLLAFPQVVALSVIVGTMAAYNIGFAVVGRQAHAPRAVAFAQIFVDLIALTLLLYFAGGIRNPFFAFYIFHVIIAGVLLRRREAYMIAGVTCLLFCGMVILERAGVIACHPLGRMPELPADYASGILAAFVATTFFSAYFTSTIMMNLRRVTAELARERTRLTEVVQGIGAALVVLDGNREIEWMNERARTWFGDAAPGTPCHEALWKSAGWCRPCLSRDVADDGHFCTFERRVGDQYFMVTSTRVCDANGEVANILEIVQDITTQKTLEEELMQAGKMAAVGQLASGIAHEINNPLASVAASRDFLEELARELELGDPFERHLARIDTNVYRCKAIIDALLGLARRDPATIVATDVNVAVHEALRLVGGQVTPVVDLCRPAPRALGNPRLLQHVLLNLFLNAEGAAGPDGRVTVSTSREDGAVRIGVSDDGPGIDPELLPRIFEPFFTTKPVGRGTGLGLFLCHRLVDAMGGQIRVESAKGEGSVFTVILERAGEMPGMARTDAAAHR